MDDEDEILAKSILQSINQGKNNWTDDNKHYVKNVYKKHKEEPKEDKPQKTLVKDWVKNKNITYSLSYLLINNFKYVEDINYYKLSKLTNNDKRYWNEFVKIKNT